MCMSERPPGNASAGVRGRSGDSDALLRIRQVLNHHASAGAAADPAQALSLIAGILSEAEPPIAGAADGLDEETFARLWWGEGCAPPR